MLKGKERYVVAVVGAAGDVGSEIADVLEERDFPMERLRLFAAEGSEESAQRAGAQGERLTAGAFREIDIVFMATGRDLSRQWAPVAAEAGCVVVDASGCWRMDPEVPLVVPEVNRGDLMRHKGIVANPGGAAIQTAVVLKPIHDAAGLRRVVVTTLHPASEAGKEAADELLHQTADLLNFRQASSRAYPHQIAFNVLPQVDSFLDNGSTAEEQRLAEETAKIMNIPGLRLTATALRVPVFNGHSGALNIETGRKLSAREARAALSNAPGVVVFDAPEKNVYPMPVDAAGRDDVYVGRIREDDSVECGINLWVVMDNLRKGAALNAVQIAEELIAVA